MEGAGSLLGCHLWPVRIQYIFSTFFLQRHDFRDKKLSNIQCVFLFLLQVYSGKKKLSF